MKQSKACRNQQSFAKRKSVYENIWKCGYQEAISNFIKKF